METGKEEQNQSKIWRNAKERRGGDAYNKAPSEGKDNEKRSGTNVTKEKPSNGEEKEHET